jgi:hypothetical protein
MLRVPVKRTLCKIPVLRRLALGFEVEFLAESSHHQGDRLRNLRALWIGADLPEARLLFSDYFL